MRITSWNELNSVESRKAGINILYMATFNTLSSHKQRTNTSVAWMDPQDNTDW